MSPGWPVYDDESQYRRIVAYLMPGETLYAVYDCKGAGTGFVGITDRRVIFYDQGMLAKKTRDGLYSLSAYFGCRRRRRRGDLSERRGHPSDGIRSLCFRVPRNGQG